MLYPFKTLGAAALELAKNPFTHFFWSQNGEDIVIARLFREKENGTYVDAGAHHPIKFSNTHYLHRFKGWSGINIDAEQSNIDAFNKARPDDINVQAFLSNEDGAELEFNVTKSGLGSTGLPISQLGQARRTNIVSSKRLTTTTLNTILEKHLGGRHVDLLTVDVEGFDLRVVSSLDFKKYAPSVIAIEDYRFHQGTSEIPGVLSRHGYLPVSHCYDTTIYTLGGAKNFS